MNKQDFKRWQLDFCAAFPETGAWLNNSPDPQTTLGYWFAALKSTDINDALQVTLNICCGVDDPIPAFDREHTPRIVAARAKALRAKRLYPKQEQPSPHPPVVKPPAGIMQKTLEALNNARETGRDPAQVLEELMPSDPTNAPRYRCLRCKDSGSLLVWTNETIYAVMHGADAIPRKRMSVACDCEAGLRVARPDENGRPTFLPIFDHEQFCEFNGYDRVDDVREWVEAKRQSRVESMPNYQPAFETGAW